jgi:quinol monooxygenase YgiN
MYMTVLTGQVAREDWTHLRSSFQQLCAKPPPGVVEIELIQSQDEPNEWKVITLWTSESACEEATRKHLTAACEQMFCDAGSIPYDKHFKLITRYQRI